MSAEDEVRALEERLVEGDASGSADTSAIFDELLDEGVLFVTAEGTRTGGKSFVVDAHRPPKRKRFDAVGVHDLVLRSFGDTVAVVCRTDFTAAGRTFAVRTVRLWRKTPRGWKVVLVTMIGTD